MAFRIDDADAAVAEPARTGVGSQGYFTGGNPAIGDPATKITAEFLNMVQKEIEAVAIAHGDALDKSDDTQLIQAIAGIWHFHQLGGAAVWDDTTAVAAITVTPFSGVHGITTHFVENGGGGLGSFTYYKVLDARLFGVERTLHGFGWQGAFDQALVGAETFTVTLLHINDGAGAGAATTVASKAYAPADGIVAWDFHEITLSTPLSVAPEDSLYVKFEAAAWVNGGSMGVHIGGTAVCFE